MRVRSFLMLGWGPSTMASPRCRPLRCPLCLAPTRCDHCVSAGLPEASSLSAAAEDRHPDSTNSDD